ncbi:MAG: substrate-binding domain-containing protein [Bryobacterales bacterium]|nr:substrate-binding domain-containing protein [Bryobacterales bacterium]
MRMTRRQAAASVAAALGLAGAGCNRGGKKRVAVIPKGTSHIFWLTVQAGSVAAGQEFGLEILWNGPATETDFSRQIQILDSYIAQRVDGIVIAASDRKALVAPIDRAMAAGIPVTVFDSGLDSTNYISYVATDNKEAGRMGAREMGRLLAGKGKIGVVQHLPGSVSTTDREDGFTEVIEKEFPGIQIAAKQYGMSDRSKSMAAAENMLTAHPDLNAFFCSTEPSATGTALAVKSRGAAGKVKIVAFDSNEAMIADLRGGVIQAMVVQDPFKIGFEAVRTIHDKVNGKTPPKRMDLEGRVITLENVDQPDVQKLLNPDLKKYLGG